MKCMTYDPATGKECNEEATVMLLIADDTGVEGKSNVCDECAKHALGCPGVRVAGLAAELTGPSMSEVSIAGGVPA